MFCWYLDPISMEFEELNEENIMYVRISHAWYSYGQFSIANKVLIVYTNFDGVLGIFSEYLKTTAHLAHRRL